MFALPGFMPWICWCHFVCNCAPGCFHRHLFCMWYFFDVHIRAPAPCKSLPQEVTQEALPRASFAQIVRRTDCAGPCDSEEWVQKKILNVMMMMMMMIYVYFDGELYCLIVLDPYAWNSKSHWLSAQHMNAGLCCTFTSVTDDWNGAHDSNDLRCHDCHGRGSSFKTANIQTSNQAEDGNLMKSLGNSLSESDFSPDSCRRHPWQLMESCCLWESSSPLWWKLLRTLKKAEALVDDLVDLYGDLRVESMRLWWSMISPCFQMFPCKCFYKYFGDGMLWDEILRLPGMTAYHCRLKHSAICGQGW